MPKKQLKDPYLEGIQKRQVDRPKGFLVSQSKVKVYRKCRYAYYLKYVEKLRKKVKSRPLQFGTIVHKMLEADAEGDDPMKALKKIEKSLGPMFKVEKEMYGEIVNDVRQIMSAYFDYWDEKELRFERRNKRSGEHKFEIELNEYGLPDVIWNGKIDAIGRTPNKLRWIVEHKTFTRKPNDDERWRNLQSSTYLRAVEILGWGSVDGMCWDYIRSKPPTRPGVLQNGSMSERNIDTLPITVLETMKERSLNPKDYQGFLDRVNADLGTWFSRIHTPVKSAVVDGVFQDFIVDIRRMIDDHGTCREKNIERHCSWCDYEPICRAELEGNDRDFIIQKDYVSGGEEENYTDAAD